MYFYTNVFLYYYSINLGEIMKNRTFKYNMIVLASAISFNALAAPSDTFDLTQFKLTLPVDEESYFGSGDDESTAEIFPGDCSDDAYTGDGLDEGYEDSSYFYSDSDDYMVFRTPMDGGESTLNSTYVRTELRELYDWDQCDSDSTANWEMTSSSTHILSGTLKVTSYDDDDPQVVVGQIHGHDSNYALVKLQYDGPDDDIRVIMNESAEDGNSFSESFGLIPGTGWWSYEIEVDGYDINISVTYDGETVTKSVTIGEGDMDDDWLDDEFYFKAGSYPQADKDSGAVFKVRFSDLDISHD